MPNKLMMSGAAAPGTPLSLSVAPSTSTPKSITLSWSAPTFPPAIVTTGYKVYRGSTLVSTQSGLSFSDTGLNYSTAYTYSVYAYNLTGNSATPATGSATTVQACSPQLGTITGNSAGGAKITTVITVGTGCYKVRIRALGPGGGGFAPVTQVHQGSCYGPYGGGGGGGYIDGTASYAPGSQVTIEVSPAALAGTTAGGAGIVGACYVGGGAGGGSSGGAGGTGISIPAGAYVVSGGTGSYDNTTAGGAAALPGQAPTGYYTHGGSKTQGCSRCSGCTGSTGNSFGGGGTNGTDSSTLWGEAQFRGGDGAPGYVVWSTSET